MSTKHKLTKQEQKVKDNAENRKFLIVLGLSTVVLIVILYVIFANK